MPRERWPEWWAWELELSAHLLKRMADRGFTELELRGMLEAAIGPRRDIAPGRWIIRCRFRRRSWDVVVAPDAETQQLVVVTAYHVRT